MDKRHTLLFGGEAVEEILKRHLGFLICGLGAGAVIADFLTLDGNSSAVRRFSEGQHIVIGEADTLPDPSKRDSDSPSFAKNTV